MAVAAASKAQNMCKRGAWTLTVPDDTSQPLAAHVTFLLEALPLARLTAIVDVGANPINIPDYQALMKAKACHVIGFEPQPEAFARLQSTKAENETYFPDAVGDGKELALHLFLSEGMTSGFAPDSASISKVFAKRQSKVKETIILKTVMLDRLKGLPEFDLLKIDIQGGELAAIKGAKRVLSAAVAVMVELRYHRLYINEPMLGGVDLELRKQGFSLHKFIDTNRRPLRSSQIHRLRRLKNRDQVIDGDAVYIRDLTTLTEWSDQQICHLAVLAASVFNSHSLVLHLLDHLIQRGLVSKSCASDYVDYLPASLRLDPEPSETASSIGLGT